MFFRSKSSKDVTPPKPKTDEPRTWFSLSDAPATATEQPAPAPPPPAPAAALEVDTASGVYGQSVLTGDDHQSTIERSRQFALALGQITAVAMHSKQHQALKLSEFRSRVVPALLNGQFALASRRDERLGVQTPVTALLWASVSDAVDHRLSDGDGGEIKLERTEWRSGAHVWVVDVFGDPATLPSLLRQLGETQWSGRPVKMFVREVDGRRVVRVIDKP